LQSPVEPLKQRSTTGENNPILHDVSDELRWRLFHANTHKINDRANRTADCITDFDAANLDRFRQTGQQISTSQDNPTFFFEWIG
jgi:hypothetical protein